MESYVCNLYLYSTLYRVVRELWVGKKGVGLGPAHIYSTYAQKWKNQSSK